jgi:tellurite resistance protein TerC
MPVDAPLVVWGITSLAIAAIVVLDFYSHVRTPHIPTFRESGLWTIVYIALAVVFGIGLGVFWGWGHGTEYFAGYLTEKSLSVDNLFVFLIIMTKFSVPRQYQQKVLLVGVVIALVLRTGFILLGAAAIEQFAWIFYAFGVFLIYTGVTLARENHAEETPEDYREGVMVRLTRRLLPTTEDYNGDRLTISRHGKRYITPMLIVMVAIGSTDLLFALDSIPAIYGLTKEPYIVFTTNAFALLGLRQLYFLVGGLLRRLVHLSEGLSVILAFIGVKLILEAMHTNEVPFINGGKPVGWAPEIPTWLSMVVIVGTLGVATATSLASTRRAARADADGTGELIVR